MTRPTLLFLLSKPTPGSAWTTAQMLAQGLVETFDCHALALASADSSALNFNGLAIESLGWRRLVDLAPFRKLRDWIVQHQPAAIHVFGITALRALLFSAPRYDGRIILSLPGKPPFRATPQAWLASLMLRKVYRIICRGAWEADPWKDWREARGKIIVLPPGATTTNVTAGREQLGIAADRFVIACIGPLERAKGIRDAIWTLDILHYLLDRPTLLIAGSGEDEPRLRAFAREIRTASDIRFLGALPDVGAVLGACDVVWVPSTGNRGLHVALEAQAAGKPVIATRQPALIEIIEHEKTGLFVGVSDKPSLARWTKRIFDDRELAKELGEAGRQRIAGQHDPRKWCEKLASVYGSSLGVLRAPQ